MNQLIRDDGVIFNVLGAKPGPFRDAVWLQRANAGHAAAGPWGFGREVLERDFTAYPPQEPRPAPTGQLLHTATGAVFDVVAVTDDRVMLQLDGIPGFDGTGVVSAPRWHVEENFTAYPPQQWPTEETGDREPLTAYRRAFCPADDKELEDGYRVVEAYAGALVDALFCGTCNRHFAADTLVEIKLWKD